MKSIARVAPWIWIAPLCAAVLFAAAWQWRASQASQAPPRRLASLGNRAPLPDAEHFIADWERAAPGRSLSAEQASDLRARIERINADLERLQEPVGAIARAWADARVESGLYRLLGPDEEIRSRPGTVLVRVSTPDGLTKDVYIEPGECAELDVIAADCDALLELGRAEIGGFLKTCTEPRS